MKSWLVAASVVVVGFILGWLVTLYGLGQPWWPLSVSGQPEVVVSGTLYPDPVGNPTGLFIQQQDRNYYVDLSRIDSKLIYRKLNQAATARGSVIDYTPSNYLLVSWLK